MTDDTPALPDAPELPRFRPAPRSVYLISPPDVDDDFPEDLEACLNTGHTALFQLRLKHGTPSFRLSMATDCLSICRRRGVPFLLNDEAETARELDADGVHLGEDDGDLREARASLPRPRLLGVSCYNRIEAAEAAVEAGADYVSFGAFFPTTTKTPKTRAETTLLQEWKRLRPYMPCCAIGGITDANVGPLFDAGADMAAVCGYVWQAEDSPVRALERLCKR